MYSYEERMKALFPHASRRDILEAGLEVFESQSDNPFAHVWAEEVRARITRLIRAQNDQMDKLMDLLY